MAEHKKKLIKVSTVPMSLDTFWEGQLRMLSDYYEVVAVSSPDPELKKVADREGVRTIAVPMQRHISLLKDVVSLVRMVRVLKKEDPVIVHSMTPKAGLISMLAAWLCRVPVRMHTYTGLVFPTATGFKQNVLIWMDRLLCACATYINPEGQGVANDLRRFHITKKPLHIIHHGNVRGINSEYWSRTPEVLTRSKQLHKELKVREGDFVFVFVGRLVGDKGINELIQAFCNMSNAKLLLVGRYEDKLDPLQSETLDLIEANENIINVGEQQDVRPYYALADAFVFPSYREGFPNTVIEAGALGLPSIVTDINGANEIIVEGKNGVIIPSKDVDALHAAMQRFVTDKEGLAAMAANARDMVLSRYEQKDIWEALLNVYQSF